MITEMQRYALMGLLGVVLLLLIFMGVAIFGGTRRRNDENTNSTLDSSTTTNTVAQAQKDDVRSSSVSLRQALAKTEENFFGRIRKLMTTAQESEVIEGIEEILYTSDLGPKTVAHLMGSLQNDLSRSQRQSVDAVKEWLKKEMNQVFEQQAQENVELAIDRLSFGKVQGRKPFVVMIVGVNGAGKTTSIGKIAAQLASKGLKVLVAAGDTFRAAAESQLKVWTDRAQVDIFSPEGVKDPSAVAFDALAKAQAQNYDIVLVDTAGRLHTQANLMEEIKKVKRVMSKVIEDAPHEILIVLDANSGQNALSQAHEFHQALGLTGVVLTKMDGTAKGGVALGLAYELKIPVKMIGVGEKIADLRPFDHHEFVDSILGS